MAVNARQRPGATFRSAVDLVLLNVTVMDTGGRHISDLSTADFQIFEDGRPQELAFFSRANTALSVSLLLDSSSSMDAQMSLAQKAAKDFVAQLRPGDVAQIVDFDSRVEVVQPFTDDKTQLAAAIDRIDAGGSTSLYNAVYISLRQMEKMKAETSDEIRREVIVVLSDGEDTSSLVTFDELLNVAKRSHTVIYTIGLGAGEGVASRKGLQDGQFALRSLAHETGGRLFTPKAATGLANVYAQIASELASQYVLGYLSNNTKRDGAWRRIAIRVRRPELQARTRPGYYAMAQ